jgi:hypothetical protein
VFRIWIHNTETKHSSNDYFRHKIRITADRKRDRPSRDLTWTTKAPESRKRGPEDIMSKPEKISNEALAAQSAGDFWSLFFTEDLLRCVVNSTNEKIEESFLKNDYSDERLRKSPYIAQTDAVICFAKVILNNNLNVK